MNSPRWTAKWPAAGIIYGLLFGVLLWAAIVMAGLAAFLWWVAQ